MSENERYSTRDKLSDNGVAQPQMQHQSQLNHVSEHSQSQHYAQAPQQLQQNLTGCMASAGTPPGQVLNGGGCDTRVGTTTSTPLQPDYLSPEFDTIRGFLMHPGY